MKSAQVTMSHQNFRPVPMALRIILPVLASLALFGILIFAVLLPSVRSSILSQKQQSMQTLVETAWGVLDACHQLEKNGALTTAQAQDQALRIVGSLRYGADMLDYFWINDMTPRMIRHPYRQDLDGQDLSGVADQDGKALFVEMADKVRREGAGFVPYRWQWKDNPNRVAAKISYVKGFAPWGWIVGTGMYMDDAEGEITGITRQLVLWSLVILGAAMFFMAVAVIRSLVAERERRKSDAALGESVQKYRLLAENMTDSVWMFTIKDMRYTYVSPSSETLLGYSVEEILQSNPFQHFTPQSREEALAVYFSALAEAEQSPGKPIHRIGVLEQIRKDGNLVDVEMSAAIVYGKDLKPEKIVGATRNVTARKRVEKALQDSEERFRAMTENSGDITFVTDRDLNPVYVSPSVKAAGWTQEEVIFMGYKKLIHPDDIPVLASAIDASFLQPGDPVRISSLRVITKGGHYAILEGLMTCLLGSPGVDGFLFNGMDVTRRRLAEEALQKSENLYRSLFENSGAATIVFGDDRTVRMCNSEFAKLTGYARDEIEGRMRWTDFFHPEEIKRLEDYHRKRSRGEPAPRLYEARIQTRNGEVRHMINRVVMVEGSKERIASFLDITSLMEMRKDKEKLEAGLRQKHKMEAIGTLAGGIAHDFNNILFPIMGYTELALEQAPNGSPIRENLDEILKATLRAKALVGQILAFSRQTEESQKPLRLGPIVEDVLRLIRASIPSFITIKQFVDKDCGVVFADSSQMHQVIMNLCTNAYQAMRETGGVLEVALRLASIRPGETELGNLTPGKSYAKLTIRDTGPGMPPEVMERIFDPYFTTKAVGEGTGMGLAIAHAIIEKHGGEIRVSSQQGQGSAFDILLPLAAPGYMELEKPASGDTPLGSGEVLLVEDESQVLAMTKKMIERLGYNVTARSSSVDALEAFRNAPEFYDIVVTDMAMPNMTGDMLAAEILKIRPGIPIILCTGFSEKTSREQAAALGISRYIMKPVVMKQMAQALSQALQEKYSGKTPGA